MSRSRHHQDASEEFAQDRLALDVVSGGVAFAGTYPYVIGQDPSNIYRSVAYADPAAYNIASGNGPLEAAYAYDPNGAYAYGPNGAYDETVAYAYDPNAYYAPAAYAYDPNVAYAYPSGSAYAYAYDPIGYDVDGYYYA